MHSETHLVWFLVWCFIHLSLDVKTVNVFSPKSLVSTVSRPSFNQPPVLYGAYVRTSQTSCLRGKQSNALLKSIRMRPTYVKFYIKRMSSISFVETCVDQLSVLNIRNRQYILKLSFVVNIYKTLWQRTYQNAIKISRVQGHIIEATSLPVVIFLKDGYNFTNTYYIKIK